jgi:hypothetical protein
MNRLAILAASLLLAAQALANPGPNSGPDQWQPHAQVGVLDNVTLRVHWHDSLKLLREAATAQNVNGVDLHGFSVLRRNGATGEWVCDLYVVKMRGALVDNDRTMTFGHEALHCFGLQHE